MAGIPVHTDSPISSNSSNTTAAKPDTSTSPPVPPTNIPARVPATTTAVPTSSYPPARPGAAAIPAPTSSASIPPSTTAIPTPTTTVPTPTTRIPDGPPPPQPGAVPSPYIPPSNTGNPSIPPPPPKAGQVPVPSMTAPTPTAAPSFAPAQPTNTPHLPGSTSSSYRSAADLSHPPGYSQNVHGSFDDRIPGPDNNSSPSRRPGVGILDSDPSSYRTSEADGGKEDSVWDTAAKWAKVAGEKLSQGEQQIWKMVDKATGEK